MITMTSTSEHNNINTSFTKNVYADPEATDRPVWYLVISVVVT